MSQTKPIPRDPDPLPIEVDPTDAGRRRQSHRPPVEPAARSRLAGPTHEELRLRAQNPLHTAGMGVQANPEIACKPGIDLRETAP